MADLFEWLFSFYILIALIVLIIYQLMVDLTFDSFSRLSKAVLLEYITLGVLCCFYLVTGHLIMLLFCTPYLYYNVTLLIEGRHLNIGYSREEKQRLFKLFYLIFILFLSSFWLING